MRQALKIACALAIVPLVTVQTAQAQWAYPSGYGSYGWGGWGGATDPASGYMAGLGSYARGQGAYEVEDAKAQAINLDTMLKWNKALRARQRALRIEEQKEQEARDVARNARVDQVQLENGNTLNNILFQIFDLDPAVARSSQAKAVIPSSTIREIPFEWDTEAITICVDQMTGKDSLPQALSSPDYVEERTALRSAVEGALKEDAKGNVSQETTKKLNHAIEAFRAKFLKNTANFDPGYSDGNDYFTTLTSLTRLLNDPSFKKIMAQLEEKKERTVGQLIAFMQAYNLRFGPATSDRQIQIYNALAPLLSQVANDLGGVPPAPSPDKSGNHFQSAAKDAFKKMDWEQLKAHAREQ